MEIKGKLVSVCNTKEEKEPLPNLGKLISGTDGIARVDDLGMNMEA